MVLAPIPKIEASVPTTVLADMFGQATPGTMPWASWRWLWVYKQRVNLRLACRHYDRGQQSNRTSY